MGVLSAAHPTSSSHTQDSVGEGFSVRGPAPPLLSLFVHGGPQSTFHHQDPGAPSSVPRIFHSPEQHRIGFCPKSRTRQTNEFAFSLPASDWARPPEQFSKIGLLEERHLESRKSYMQNTGLAVYVPDPRALTPPATATAASVLLPIHSGEGPQVT